MLKALRNLLLAGAAALTLSVASPGTVRADDLDDYWDDYWDWYDNAYRPYYFRSYTTRPNYYSAPRYGYGYGIYDRGPYDYDYGVRPYGYGGYYSRPYGYRGYGYRTTRPGFSLGVWY